MIKPKTPPPCKINGINGNAMCIIGAGAKALKKAGADKEYIDQYRKEALSSNYENVIQTTMKYCDVN